MEQKGHNTTEHSTGRKVGSGLAALGVGFGVKRGINKLPEPYFSYIDHEMGAISRREAEALKKAVGGSDAKVFIGPKEGYRGYYKLLRKRNWPENEARESAYDLVQNFGHYLPELNTVYIPGNSRLTLAHELSHSNSPKLLKTLRTVSNMKAVRNAPLVYGLARGATSDDVSGTDLAVMGGLALPQLAEESRANWKAYRAMKKLYGKLSNHSKEILIGSEESYLRHALIPFAVYGSAKATRALINKYYKNKNNSKSQK